MKLCPKCNLNWIEDEKEFCTICDNQKQLVGNNSIGGGGKNPTAHFQEEFTFTMQKAFYRGKIGFQAYNSKGENVGLVFMCDDKRIPMNIANFVCILRIIINMGSGIELHHMVEE